MSITFLLEIEDNYGYGNFYNDMLEGFVADYLPFFPCKAGLVSLFVTVKGELYPCIETGKKYMIGSVDKGLDAEYIRKNY